VHRMRPTIGRMPGKLDDSWRRALGGRCLGTSLDWRSTLNVGAVRTSFTSTSIAPGPTTSKRSAKTRRRFIPRGELSAWRALLVRLARHAYLAKRIEAPDLSQVHPFRLLAEGVPRARADMGDQTLVVIAATFKDGRDGCYLLNDRAGIAKADTASGEELLDHSCAVLGPQAPS